MVPRSAAALALVTLLAAGCTSEPSAAEKSAASSAAREHAIAGSDVQRAVRAIKLCARQNDGEYPPAVKNVRGMVTMLCGPVSQVIKLTHGNRLTYRPKAGGGFTVDITSPGGGTAHYATKPVGSAAPS